MQDQLCHHQQERAIKNEASWQAGSEADTESECTGERQGRVDAMFETLGVPAEQEERTGRCNETRDGARLPTTKQSSLSPVEPLLEERLFRNATQRVKVGRACAAGEMRHNQSKEAQHDPTARKAYR